MATIRFTAAERPGLLAEAVLGATENVQGAVPLRDLAAALKGHNGKRFDELLCEHFPEVAHARVFQGDAPAFGVDPATGGEAELGEGGL